jgi:hypothetical protein
VELIHFFNFVFLTLFPFVSVFIIVRLAEAFAEYMHAEVRKKHWGYAPDEDMSAQQMHKIKYRVCTREEGGGASFVFGEVCLVVSFFCLFRRFMLFFLLSPSLNLCVC